MVFFLTKPIFVSFFYDLTGNRLVNNSFNTCLKTALFPLTYKSYVSMSKLKLQPEMEKLKNELVGIE